MKSDETANVLAAVESPPWDAVAVRRNAADTLDAPAFAARCCVSDSRHCCSVHSLADDSY